MTAPTALRDDWWHVQCSGMGTSTIQHYEVSKKNPLNYLIREEHDDKLALNAARWFQPDLILVDTAGQDRRNIEREISSDAALKDTPVLSLSNLRPESQMVSGGILSGYSFFAAPIRVEEVLRGVDDLLFGKD